MADQNLEMLRQGVARNLGAVLSLPSAGMLRHYKSRFLSESGGMLLMESPSGEAALIGELITKQSPCGVSFRSGNHKVMFAAPILKVEAGWRVNESTIVDALALQFPTQIKSMQRRANYRAEVPADFELSVRVWRINDRAYLNDLPMAAQEVKAQVRDLSTGGIGVRLLGKDGQLPRISVEDRLRVQITHEQESFIIEGRMRQPVIDSASNSYITGIQFKKLENDINGRRMLAQLTRMVGELQRSEMRRMRLGLSRASA